jgi:phosphoenolpyruvate carboxykinase (GTP)
VFERALKDTNGRKTPIGIIPEKLDLEGLKIDPQDVKKLFEINIEEWEKSANELQGYFKQFGSSLPQGIEDELKGLSNRLQGR